MEPVSKGEFATIIKVSPGRVSQMISEGKISGDAIVGEGRSAKINVEVARQQIRARTDVGQSLGNGAGTRVYETAPVTTVADTSSPRPPTVDDELRRERLANLRFQNRRAAEEERERQGLYVRTDQVQAEMTKLAAQMLTIFEGAFPDLANALSAKFDLPQRDILHILREQGRAVRQKAADAARKKAVSLPEFIEDRVADATDEAVGQA
jgi:hypothetical protein